MYAATTGTFLQRDPAGYTGEGVLEYSHRGITNWLKARGTEGIDPNLYEYARSNPLKYVDPMGLDAISEIPGKCACYLLALSCPGILTSALVASGMLGRDGVYAELGARYPDVQGWKTSADGTVFLADDGSPANALVHCTFACRLAFYSGPGCTHLWSMCREKSGAEQKDRIDMFNDSVGYVNCFPSLDCAACCKSALDSGKLSVNK